MRFIHDKRRLGSCRKQHGIPFGPTYLAEYGYIDPCSTCSCIATNQALAGRDLVGVYWDQESVFLKKVQ